MSYLVEYIGLAPTAVLAIIFSYYFTKCLFYVIE